MEVLTVFKSNRQPFFACFPQLQSAVSEEEICKVKEICYEEAQEQNQEDQISLENWRVYKQYSRGFFLDEGA